MKNILKSFCSLVCILGLLNCSPKIQKYTGEVNFLYKEEQGTIAVKSIGYGQNQTEAVANAQINTLKVILFKGLPGTELNVPLINNENEALLQHREYFKNFFDQNHYKTFVMSCTESSNLIKISGAKKIYVDIKINYNSLRNSLEQNKIIRKFGY